MKHLLLQLVMFIGVCSAAIGDSSLLPAQPSPPTMPVQSSSYRPWFALRSTVWASQEVAICMGDAAVPHEVLWLCAQIVRQYALPSLAQELGLAPAQAQILLFSNKESYAVALEATGIPLEEIPYYSTKSGGVTIGRDIWIPLYAWPDSSGLAYTLTHELTHVSLEENGLNLPEWLNEGLAWYIGWDAQEEMNPALIVEYKNYYFRELQEAVLKGQLLPLAIAEQDILKAPYNVEWQDYLAVEGLLSRYGLSTVSLFLQQSKRVGVKDSFQKYFGISLGAYERRFHENLLAESWNSKIR